MPWSKTAVVKTIQEDAFPAWKTERDRLDKLDKWIRWDHDSPHAPRTTQTHEYKELAGRSQAPWGGLIVTTLAQQLFVEGYRPSNATENSPSWRAWRANGMPARQNALHRAAGGYGYSFLQILPGRSGGSPMPVMRGVSPRRGIAFYRDPAEDEWPHYFLKVDPAKINGNPGYNLQFVDDTEIHYLTIGAVGEAPNYLQSLSHGIGHCPYVRYANILDLEGRCDGEIEPVIPLLARIDQTAFDRLVVQRFASWVVRTIAGMVKPTAEEEAAAARLRLAVEDILIAEDPDTKFGYLPATPLEGFIKAHEHDLHTLAAVSQTPAHEMLGQMANLSAEALAAARASLNQKAEERKQGLGESHAQSLRLCARLMGDREGAVDFETEVRWKDMEPRSFAQAADALGKLAQILSVPVERLWEKIPGLSEADVNRARDLVTSGGGIEALLAELAAGQQTDPALAAA